MHMRLIFHVLSCGTEGWAELVSDFLYSCGNILAMGTQLLVVMDLFNMNACIADWPDPSLLLSHLCCTGITVWLGPIIDVVAE